MNNISQFFGYFLIFYKKNDGFIINNEKSVGGLTIYNQNLFIHKSFYT